jgi:hypothetical protein
MIKEVFITPATESVEKRFADEIAQGLLLDGNGNPAGIYIDVGLHFIRGKPYFIGIQVFP